MPNRNPTVPPQPPLATCPFSPLACSAGARLLVAAAIATLLWCVVFWALNPNYS